MQKIHIMADSPCDLSPEDVNLYNIEILPISVTYGGQTKREFFEIDRREFWRDISALDEIPSTAQFTPTEYCERFRRALDGGFTHIICITISSTASGTYTSGIVARDMFYEEYGDNMKIEIVDSRGYSIIYGRIVREAARLRGEGALFEDILERASELISRSEAMLTVFTLKHLKKSGRITGAAAFVGDIVGLRPILYIRDGLIDVRTKSRGDRNAVTAMITEIEDLIENPADQDMQILYAEVSPELVDWLEEALREKFCPSSIERVPIGPCVAANTGPNALAVCYYGKKRTKI